LVTANVGEASGGAGVAASDDAVWFTQWSGQTLYRLPTN
jgi:hypothetical protein